MVSTFLSSVDAAFLCIFNSFGKLHASAGLTGHLDPRLGELPTLQRLNLARNALHGSVPPLAAMPTPAAHAIVTLWKAGESLQYYSITVTD